MAACFAKMAGRRYAVRNFPVWIWLLLKRLLKKPAFICLLLAMPVLATAFGLLERETDHRPAVGIVWEDNAVTTEAPEWETFLTDSVNVFDYRTYDSVDALIWAVKRRRSSLRFCYTGRYRRTSYCSDMAGKDYCLCGEG